MHSDSDNRTPYKLQLATAKGNSRTRAVAVRLQPAELERMSNAARVNGQSLTEWMRATVLRIIHTETGDLGVNDIQEA